MTDTGSTTALPAPEDFFLEEPLYRPLRISTDAAMLAVLDVEFYSGSLSAYCTQCKAESIFRTDRIQSGELLTPFRRPHAASNVNVSVSQRGTVSTRDRLHIGPSTLEYAASDRCFTVEFYCTRQHDHRINFSFSVRAGCIQKSGQFPSLSDFQRATTERIRKLLTDPLAAAYTRAINLHAFDVGAGSFVYLRRIFESLIEDAHKVAAAEEGWNEDGYQRMHVPERISVLKSHLPEFMSENSSVYSILSNGVHEMSEEDCQIYFPVLKTAIDMMLEEKFAEKQRKMQRLELSKALKPIANRSK